MSASRQPDPWPVIEWLRANFPRALELCPYKIGAGGLLQFPAGPDDYKRLWLESPLARGECWHYHGPGDRCQCGAVANTEASAETFTSHSQRGSQS